MKYLGYVLGAGTFLAALAGPASAADVVPYANPFNGFYFGVHGGYGWADTESTVSRSYAFCYLGFCDPNPEDRLELEDDYSVDSKGAFLGAQAGANFVMDQGILLGAEVSGSWTAMSGDDSFESENPYIDSQVSVDQEINAIGLAQAKLGWANDTVAIYATGGLALASVSTEIDIKERFLGDIGDISDDQTLTGWTLGAAIDYMVTDNVSIGVAYNYVDFGDYNTEGSVDSGGLFGVAGDVNDDADLHVNMVRANLNYHF